ncbi:MAG: response regulator transcription factor [Candidatus Adiutrix sp.]
MNNITLLVADDELIVRKFINLVIQDEKLPVAKVLEANNGREAVEMALEHRPDLLLLDIRMPGVDGLMAAKQILAAWPSAYIVIVTAYDDFDYVRVALRSGVLDYVLKPLGPSVISGLVLAAAKRSPKEPKASVEKISSQAHPMVVAVANYVAANLESALNLEDISKAVFVSASHLSRQFKKLKGQTLSEYIANCRVEKAKELLEFSYLSMTEIAGLVGFSNAAYFTSWFKKNTGLPPLRYRKNKC